MNEEMTHQMAATAAQLGSAAEALERVIGKLDAQHEALNQKSTASSRRWRKAERETMSS